LTPAELERLAAMAGGVRRIFAFGSPSFKKLGRGPESFSEAELVQLILAEPRYLRRPLAVRDGRVYVGGREVAGAVG
jgi:arsenate reductase